MTSCKTVKFIEIDPFKPVLKSTTYNRNSLLSILHFNFCSMFKSLKLQLFRHRLTTNSISDNAQRHATARVQGARIRGVF